jgi:hypothetical protein
MDEIQIYNYLNRVKPFFKRQEALTEEPVVTGGSGKAHPTRHIATLKVVGGVYKCTSKIKNGGASGSESKIDIILYD